MSEENAEIVRRSWEGWMKGDATALAVFHRDVVFEDDFLPDHVGETYRGVQGLQKAWFVWAEPWDEFETELEWVRGAGTDAAVSCHRARMRGKGSGVKGERRYAYLWRFRAGKIVYCKAFGEPNEALEAVGLSE